MKLKSSATSDYTAFVVELKSRITLARISAARAVNRDLILLYWDIGRGIVEKQATLGWGESVVEMLAKDLQMAFPEMRGFSADNLWRMRQFYTEYVKPAFLEQAVPEMKEPCGKFLGQAVPEIARNTNVADGGQIPAQAVRELVAFELKVGPFEPEFAGKMDFYLNLLNDKERGPDDRPSIGIILCAEKDNLEVEFALKTKTNPSGVAEYQLLPNLPPAFKGKLPTPRQLTDAIRSALPAKPRKRLK